MNEPTDITPPTETSHSQDAPELANDTATSLEALLAAGDQPYSTVTRDGTHYTILGTAHVSKTSADEVKRLIDSSVFDAVAIELDANRYATLAEPERWAKLDLFKVLKEGKAGVLASSLALGAFQQRLADQLGIRPGEEMRAAISEAKAKNLPLLLIDRDVGVTLKRVYRNVPWWQRFTLLAGLLASVMSNEEISEQDIEKLKEGDMLESTFAEFAEESKSLYEPLISERDHYMAAKLRSQAGQHKHVLVVIGAGHLKGLTEALANSDADPRETQTRLETVPKGTSFWRVIPWVFIGLILSGFVIGFARSPELGWQITNAWFLINGGLAALGAIIALAHPLTIIGVFAAAPLTSLNPFIGAGFVAAAIELFFKKPRVGDFSDLRQDVTTARGWWRNRVARTLLVFILTTLGSAIGTYIGGFRIVTLLRG
jgi:pheromone shutdown-related protein TraB